MLADRRESRLKLRAWKVFVGCYESAERLHAIEATYSDLEQKYIKHEALMALFFALKQTQYPGLRLNVVLNNEISLLGKAQYHFDKIFKHQLNFQCTVSQFVQKCNNIIKTVQRKSEISEHNTSRTSRLRQAIQCEQSAQNDNTSKKLQEIRIMLQQASRISPKHTDVQSEKSDTEITASLVSDIQAIKTIFGKESPAHQLVSLSASVDELLKNENINSP